MKQMKWSAIYRKYGVFIILVVEVLIFMLLSENFRTLENVMTIGRQVASTGIAAVGATFLMLTGGIDISNGSMLAFSGVLAALLSVNLGLPLPVAFVITLLCGLGFGLINGVAYTRFKVSPLIATLAMQTILKGIAYLLTSAKPIYGIADAFKFIGQGYLFGFFPFPLLLMIIAFAFGFWVLDHTYIGRYIYAVGGNAEAARLSGINTNKVYMIAFGASALFASIAGLMMAGRLGSGQPAIGTDFPMDVITAIVLGGVSINGGSGKISGVLFGVFIMGVLSNGMIMVGLNDYWQWVIKGVVLLAAVAMSNVEVRKR
ncbi:ABC transporter permease [Agathobaculum sp. Marseille-P7918]|uniref:ABC transporter permease n=1 Tax=Agathobaculum sp. Marseille-P7918 TaxID=2479843 RepID=UPI000F6438EA|nr:ABC transporter permease [Agathobaculum sp. Marseille-P7918]